MTYWRAFASYLQAHGPVLPWHTVIVRKTFFTCNREFAFAVLYKQRKAKHCPLDSHESYIATLPNEPWCWQRTFRSRSRPPRLRRPTRFHNERGNVVVSIDPSGPRSNPRPPFRECQSNGRPHAASLPDHQHRGSEWAAAEGEGEFDNLLLSPSSPVAQDQLRTPYLHPITALSPQ